VPDIRNPIEEYKSLPPDKKFRWGRRIWRSIIGFTVLGIGFIMIVAPGPAIVVIPVGLAILATEYAWARRYLSKFKDHGQKLGRILLPNWKKKS
jgi:tellurite resistance protein TerC